MKKRAALLLALTLVAGLMTACGQDKTTDDMEQGNGGSATTNEMQDDQMMDEKMDDMSGEMTDDKMAEDGMENEQM